MTLSLNQPQTIPASSTRLVEKPEIAAENLKLKHILRTLPRELFLKDSRKAWTQVAINIVMVALGYASIIYSPWYLLPLAWIFTGTALTGFFCNWS